MVAVACAEMDQELNEPSLSLLRHIFHDAGSMSEVGEAEKTYFLILPYAYANKTSFHSREGKTASLCGRWRLQGKKKRMFVPVTK